MKDISWKWHTPRLQVCPATTQRFPNGRRGGNTPPLPQPVKYESSSIGACSQSFLLNISNSWNSAIGTTWRGLEVTALSELSQSQKDKYCTLPCTGDTEHRLTEAERRLAPASGCDGKRGLQHGACDVSVTHDEEVLGLCCSTQDMPLGIRC